MAKVKEYEKGALPVNDQWKGIGDLARQLVDKAAASPVNGNG